MPKSSLLIINKNFPPVQSATGRLAFDLAHHMQSQGWKVSVLCAAGNAAQDNQIDVISVKRPKNVENFLGRFLILLRFFLASFKIKPHHVVITMTDSSPLLFLNRFFVKRKTTKNLLWIQDLYPDKKEALEEKQYPAARIKSLKAFKKFDKIIVTGRCMNSKIRQKNILPDKIAFIPNWTNLHGVHLMGEGEKIINQESVDLPETIKRDESPRFRIIYPGNLGKEHPVGVIIRAAELLKSHTEIEFLFVGDRHANSRLSRERERKELHNIKLIPYQPTSHYRRILESGDVHLVTLRPRIEGCVVPCKFYSSLLVGRPVIFLGPKNSEIGRVITEFKCGDIIEEMKAEKLADVILKYRHEGQAWFDAQEGAIKAAENYSPEKSLDQWSSLLNKL